MPTLCKKNETKIFLLFAGRNTGRICKKLIKMNLQENRGSEVSTYIFTLI